MKIKDEFEAFFYQSTITIFKETSTSTRSQLIYQRLLQLEAIIRKNVEIKYINKKNEIAGLMTKAFSSIVFGKVVSQSVDDMKD